MTDRLRLPPRRGVLAGLAALPFAGLGGDLARAEEPPRRPTERVPVLHYGPPRPFRYESLVDHAKSLAGQPYRPPVVRHAEVLGRIFYDQHQQIAMRRNLAPRTAKSP